MLKKINLLFLIVSGLNAICFSQPTNDAGLWTTFTIEKEFKNNTTVFLTEEYRLKENFTRTNLFYTDIGVSVRPVKPLKISLSYRSIEKYILDNTFSFRHRLMLDILVKQKIGNYIFAFRERIQSEVRNIYSSDNGAIPEWYSRSKIQVKYDLHKPITPYIAAELRYQINNPRNIESNRLWHRQRYSAGIDYKQNDRNTFGLYYLIQNEFSVSSPQNLYIVGVEYTLIL